MIELNKIYNEDCLEGMKKVSSGSVDLIVSDPPYLLNNTGGVFISKPTSDTLRSCRKSRTALMWQYSTSAVVS